MLFTYLFDFFFRSKLSFELHISSVTVSLKKFDSDSARFPCTVLVFAIFEHLFTGLSF